MTKRTRNLGSGSHLQKYVVVRIIKPEGHKEDKRTFHAKPGKLYTPEGIEQLLANLVDYIDKTFPHWEFRMVQIAENRFNFVYEGLRENGCNRPSADGNNVQAPPERT